MWITLATTTHLTPGTRSTTQWATPHHHPICQTITASRVHNISINTWTMSLIPATLPLMGILISELPTALCHPHIPDLEDNPQILIHSPNLATPFIITTPPAIYSITTSPTPSPTPTTRIILWIIITAVWAIILSQLQLRRQWVVDWLAHPLTHPPQQFIIMEVPILEMVPHLHTAIIIL